jgi:hypothetical protein
MRGEGEVEEESLHDLIYLCIHFSSGQAGPYASVETTPWVHAWYTKEATPALACHAIRPLHRQVRLALVVLLMEAVAVGCSRAFDVISLEMTMGLFLLAAAVFITG